MEKVKRTAEKLKYAVKSCPFLTIYAASVTTLTVLSVATGRPTLDWLMDFPLFGYFVLRADLRFSSKEEVEELRKKYSM